MVILAFVVVVAVVIGAAAPTTTAKDVADLHEPQLRAVNGSIEFHVKQGNTLSIVEHDDEAPSPTRVDALNLLRNFDPLTQRQVAATQQLNDSIADLQQRLSAAEVGRSMLSARVSSEISAVRSSQRQTIQNETTTLAASLSSEVETKADEVLARATAHVRDLDRNVTHRLTTMEERVGEQLREQNVTLNAIVAQFAGLVGDLAPRVAAVEKQLQALQPLLEKIDACSGINDFVEAGGTCYSVSGVCPDPTVEQGVSISLPTTVQPDVIEYLPGVVVKFGCPPNHYFPGDRTATCLRSLKWSRDPPSCHEATTCMWGQYVTTEPTNSSDRECEECSSNTFSNTNNAASCSAHQTCGVDQYVSAQPSPSSDRGCTSCPNGLVQPSSSYTGTTCYVYKKIGISSCSASSEHSGNYRCENAYDGNWHDGHGNAWATLREGTGSWIRFYFPQNVRIRRMRYKQRDCNCEWYKQLRLEFSDGSRRTVTLPNAQGPIIKDFEFSGTARWVLVRALSVYSTYNNGFNEVEFYGIEV